MRPIKELLQLMLENKKVFYYGLCHMVSQLEIRGIITFAEGESLRYYIESHRPNRFSSFKALAAWLNGGRFYWPPYDIKPRIKWLKKHIKLNS